jgi:AcrR family transcriptional regulator
MVKQNDVRFSKWRGMFQSPPPLSVAKGDSACGVRLPADAASLTIQFVQVKKPQIRDAILASAFDLFSRKGYVETTLPQIAAGANVSTTNLYSYFESKLAILYAIHGPWMRAQLDALDAQLAEIKVPRVRLRRLFMALFREIPAREHGLANNVMQAIATVRPEDRYRSTLIIWLEERIHQMVRDALPVRRRRMLEKADVAHFLVMAMDGYIVFHHVAPRRSCDDATIELLCDLFLGSRSGKMKFPAR